MYTGDAFLPKSLEVPAGGVELGGLWGACAHIFLVFIELKFGNTTRYDFLFLPVLPQKICFHTPQFRVEKLLSY